MQKCLKLTPKQTNELKDVVRNNDSTGAEVRRAQTILLVDQEVESTAITAVTGYSRRHAFTLRRRYLENGISAIQDKRQGQPKALLAKKQREEVIAAVKTTKPSDHQYNSQHWTTGILGDFIKRKYRVQYKSKTSYYLLFKGAKFTYHKPGRVYEKRDEAAVKEWRKAAKIRVEQALQAEPKTVILTGDQINLSTQTTFQKIWLPANEFPKIEISNQRESRSIYGFLNVRTGQEHAFKTKWQNMYITRDILGKLRKIYPDQKILLIWDQAPWHRGSKAQEFINQDGNIETIYFPRAAPEENPQEHVWKKGRSQITHNRFIQDIDQTTDEFVKYLNNAKFLYSFLNIDFSAVL